MSEQTPYILATDTREFHTYLLDMSEHYGKGQFVYIPRTREESRIAVRNAFQGIRAYARGQDFQEDLSPDTGFEQIANRVLRAVEERGTLPAAYIGCPYVSKKVLEGTRNMTGLIEQGFSGPTAITCGIIIGEREYRERLPTLFATNPQIISGKDDAGIISQALEKIAEKAGLTPLPACPPYTNITSPETHGNGPKAGPELNP